MALPSSRPGVAALAALALAASPSPASSSPLEATRLAHHTTVGALAAWGARLYWTGRDPGETDSELFAFDATQPIDAGLPGVCPATNPCRITANEGNEAGPRASVAGVVWVSGAKEIWTERGAGPEAVGGWTPHAYVGVDLADHLLTWIGRDAAGNGGVFLADLSQPFGGGAALPCPASNPCRIAGVLERTFYDVSGPSIAGTRVAWSDRESTTHDLEVFFYDAALPMDTAPPLACPLSNPCRVTDDDLASASPVVSADSIAWSVCTDRDCTSEMPIAIRVRGAHVLDLETSWIGSYLELDGRWLTWPWGLGGMGIVDLAQPIDVPSLGWPRPCDDSNPCDFSYGSIQLGRVGSRFATMQGSDIPGPEDVVLADLARPLAPGPPASCPIGNPCILASATNGSAVLASAVFAWVQCEPAQIGAYCPGTEELWVTPEPGAAATALAALAALVGRRVRAKRSA